jgi:hypothetical protein
MNNEFNLDLAKCGRIVKAAKVDGVIKQEVFYAKLVEPVGDWDTLQHVELKTARLIFYLMLVIIYAMMKL